MSSNRNKIRKTLERMAQGTEFYSSDLSARTGITPFSIGKILIEMNDLIDRIPDVQKRAGRYLYRRK